MSHDEDSPEYEKRVEHSHSRITKFLEELGALAEAVQSSGSYESHHREEAELFLRRLHRDFENHVDYEENDLFPRLRDEVGETGHEAIERAVEEHLEILDLLEALAEHLDQLEVGIDASSSTVGEWFEGIERLESMAEAHDETEATIFEAVSEGDADEVPNG